MIRKQFASYKPVILLASFTLAMSLVSSIPTDAIGHPQQSENPSMPVTSATAGIFLPLVSNGEKSGGVTLLVDADARSGCDPSDYAVAALVGQFPSHTPMLDGGDDTNTGTYSEYTSCFDLAWGAYKSQLYPVPGNHEYYTSGASGYFRYWGAQAHNPTSYYSFDVGTWHVIALNSVIDTSANSAQVAWLKHDLATHPNPCTLAFWHYPLYSSGDHGNTLSTQPLYQALYDANADVVVNGHDHDYERFAPQDANGNLDRMRGVTEFVVGTMGAPHARIVTMKPNSVVFNNSTWGLLQMTLYASSYDWQFLPVAGSTFTDSGSAKCH